MDYWDDLDVTTYIDFQDFMEKNPGAKIYMATTKAPNVYTDVNYEPDCYIMFGKESAGIPEEIFDTSQGGQYPNSDGGRYQIFESWEFCGDCIIRSIEAKWISEYDKRGAFTSLGVGLTPLFYCVIVKNM